MTSLDKQLEELISERNSFEKEVVALKAQVNELHAALVVSFNGAWDDNHAIDIDKQVREALASTPDKCMDKLRANNAGAN